MEKKNRLRAPNFTNNDNLLLCDIISKYKNVIESKKTDGANLLQKQKAWLEVVKEFNSITTGYTRTVESLQQNYKNLKKKAKKNAADIKMDIPVDKATLLENIEEYGTSSAGCEKISNNTGIPKPKCQEIFTNITKEAAIKERTFKKTLMQTGGGPPPKCDDDPLTEKVKNLVGPSFDGMYTIYDGDSCLMKLNDTAPIEIKIIEEENSKEVVDAGEDSSNLTSNIYTVTQESLTSQDQAYFTNNRANLKKKPHDLLTRKRKLESQVSKQTVSDKFKSLACAKLELVKLQQELVEIQLTDEKEKLEHNRLLRALEMDNVKKQNAHNEIIRKLELENKQV